MASLLAPYGSAEASEVARDLDKNIESLIIPISRAAKVAAIIGRENSDCSQIVVCSLRLQGLGAH